MLLSAFDVPASHRLTTPPLTGVDLLAVLAALWLLLPATLTNELARDYE